MIIILITERDRSGNKPNNHGILKIALKLDITFQKQPSLQAIGHQTRSTLHGLLAKVKHTLRRSGRRRNSQILGSQK
jgi:hypothetical protein